MASERLTELAVDLDAAASEVIDEYLAELADRLPRQAPLAVEVCAELRADLAEATLALVPESPSPVAAARAATAQFGDIDDVAAAFRPELAVRQARRTGLALLATGPLVGALWLIAVFLTSGPASAWRWLPLLMAPLLVIGAPATVLTVATTGRLTRWLRPDNPVPGRAAAVAGLTAGTLDVCLLLGAIGLLLSPVPAPSPLVALAAAASLTRLVLVGRAAIRLHNARPPLGPLSSA